MPTYGNGDFCSRLLFNAINRSYIERVENYHSYCKHKSKEASAYVEKDGYYIRNYPPLGDGIRDAYDAACASQFTPWKVSDHDRHTREIQSVSCRLIFAQDHTHEVTKNYIRKKRMGAVALWDVATETGEIASAVLVPSTQTKHFAHAAAALTRRPTFNPLAMCSDTWPSKSSFWGLLFQKEVIGRLGLFHFIQQITRTLKKRHVDHFVCVNALLNCIYQYHQDDYEKLLTALKSGTLGSTKYTDDEIADLKSTKVFRRRCDKYLRKEMRPPNVLCSMLDEWFDRFKCTTSDSTRPARGRLDPFTGETLFTSETKAAVLNCKEKASFVQDLLPFEQMYEAIGPSPNSTHQLNEYISRRGESCLEAFHLMLAHFGTVV